MAALGEGWRGNGSQGRWPLKSRPLERGLHRQIKRRIDLRCATAGNRRPLETLLQNGTNADEACRASRSVHAAQTRRRPRVALENWWTAALIRRSGSRRARLWGGWCCGLQRWRGHSTLRLRITTPASGLRVVQGVAADPLVQRAVADPPHSLAPCHFARVLVKVAACGLWHARRFVLSKASAACSG